MTQHTPTPWFLNPRENKYQAVGNPKEMAILESIGHAKFDALSIGAENGQVAIIPLDESNKGNAEFIVRACNSHDDMLEALEDCDRAFALWQIGQIPGRPEDILALIAKTRKAIQKARGEI